MLIEIGTLSLEQQQIMVMRFEYGMNIREIAAAISKDERSVDVLYRSALDFLRPSLEAVCGAR